MNKGGRVTPLSKIFKECNSLTRVRDLIPYWRLSMNVKFNSGGTLIFPNTFVDLPNGMLNWEWGPSTLQRLGKAQALRVYIHIPCVSHGFFRLLQVPAFAAQAGAMRWLALGLAAFAAYWAPKVLYMGWDLRGRYLYYLSYNNGSLEDYISYRIIYWIDIWCFWDCTIYQMNSDDIILYGSIALYSDHVYSIYIYIMQMDIYSIYK